MFMWCFLLVIGGKITVIGHAANQSSKSKVCTYLPPVQTCPFDRQGYMSRWIHCFWCVVGRCLLLSFFWRNAFAESQHLTSARNLIIWTYALCNYLRSSKYAGMFDESTIFGMCGVINSGVAISLSFDVMCCLANSLTSDRWQNSASCVRQACRGRKASETTPHRCTHYDDRKAGGPSLDTAAADSYGQKYSRFIISQLMRLIGWE